jgi:hypothetical protein
MFGGATTRLNAGKYGFGMQPARQLEVNSTAKNTVTICDEYCTELSFTDSAPGAVRRFASCHVLTALAEIPH